MEASENNSVDVLIAGAGPAGLMMACQLALHNVSFRIIDKKTSSPKYSGALIVHARTMEIFQQMGLADQMVEAGIIAKTINLRFNRQKELSIDVSSFGGNLTAFPHLLMIEQWQTERLLARFLNENGHKVESGAFLADFRQKNDEVIATVHLPDKSIETIKSRFLIGADGAESFVRQHLHIAFPGKTHTSRLFITDCKVTTPLNCRDMSFSFSRDLTSGFFPLTENRCRIDGLIPSLQHNSVSFNEVAKFFDSNCHDRIKLSDPSWFSVFRSHSRCSEHFRNKQCFLIGDAAHVHSPVGAQGMNTGLQDAHNLAWKLAFSIRGLASEKLLDSYQSDRMPLALSVIRYTDLAYSFLTSDFIVKKSIRLYFLPTILRVLFALFKNKQGIRERFFIAISGLGIKYKNSIQAPPFSKGNFSARSPKPGERLPYLTFEHHGIQSSLHNGLTPKCFLLLVFGSKPFPARFQSVLHQYEKIISIRFIYRERATQLIFDRFDIKEEGCYLVRPDSYIAWRSREYDAVGLNDYFQFVLQ